MGFLELLKSRMGDDEFSLIERTGQLAHDMDTKLYLVGGAIRDILLGLPVRDLDMVVEGDAGAFVDSMIERFQVNVTHRSQFSTFGVDDSGLHLDIAESRTEHYRYHGALPEISKANIVLDLQRRDFSINAMAFPLHVMKDSELLDVDNGREDIRKRFIRILHDESFLDDPTRIMRALRYKQRLGFQLDDMTKELVIRDASCLENISPDRLGREFRLWLKEITCGDIIQNADEMGVLAAILPELSGNSTFFNISRNDVLYESGDELLNLALLSYKLTADGRNEFATRLALPGSYIKVLNDMTYIEINQYCIAGDGLSNESLYNCLNSLASSAVKVHALLNDDENVRNNLSLFLRELAHIKCSLSGADLVNMGVPIGPDIGVLLRMLHSARLEQSVSTREEEIYAIQKWVLEGQGRATDSDLD